VRPSIPFLLLLAVVASACQLSLATDIDVQADGSGRFELAVALDDELEAVLDDAGVDLTLGLADAAGAAPDWEVEDDPEGPGRRLSLRTTFDEPGQLARLVEELHDGLAEGDPGLLDEVTLEVDEDGAARFRAEAGLTLPATAGAAGDGVTFDVEDLRELLAEEGERVVRYDLRLTLPGTPVAHDADVRDGRSLTWRLPVDGTRRIEARSEPPADRTLLLAGAVFLGAAVLGTGAAVALRRRRR
jgi:hypothetical protein